MTHAGTPIEHVDDPRIADYRAVRDRDLLGAAGRPGRFIAESRLVVERLLGLPIDLVSILVETRHAAHMAEVMRAHDRAHVPLYTASFELLQALAGFHVHRGILAIGRRPDLAALELARAVPAEGPATLLLCEGITNADNMGGLYRVAAALGVNAILLSPTCHDHLYRKAIRVSMGHALTVPTVRSGDWSADIERLRKTYAVTIVAAATGPDSEALDATTVPARIGLLVGPEGEGLSAETLARCDRRVRIPMAGNVDSLNVTVAAAICLHRLSQGERR